MTQDWKPGDLVSAYVPTRNKRHALVYLGTLGGSHPWRLLDDGLDVGRAGIGATNVRDARPLIAALADRALVVIDAEDREQVERLAMLLVREKATLSDRGVWHSGLAAALREFASPTPPKPDEPLGLGAVVEDTKGEKWIRVNIEADLPRPWAAQGNVGGNMSGWCAYADIKVVRVLSQGVPS